MPVILRMKYFTLKPQSPADHMNANVHRFFFCAQPETVATHRFPTIRYIIITRHTRGHPLFLPCEFQLKTNITINAFGFGVTRCLCHWHAANLGRRTSVLSSANKRTNTQKQHLCTYVLLWFSFIPLLKRTRAHPFVNSTEPVACSWSRGNL